MRARVAAAWLLLALLAAAAGAPEASQPQSPLDEPGRRGGDGRGDHADVSALMDMFFPWGAPNPSGSKNPVVPPGQFFNETLANAMAQGVITEAQRQRICDLRLGLYSYYWAIVGDPITTVRCAYPRHVFRPARVCVCLRRCGCAAAGLAAPPCACVRVVWDTGVSLSVCDACDPPPFVAAAARACLCEGPHVVIVVHPVAVGVPWLFPLSVECCNRRPLPLHRSSRKCHCRLPSEADPAFAISCPCPVSLSPFPAPCLCPCQLSPVPIPRPGSLSPVPCLSLTRFAVPAGHCSSSLSLPHSQCLAALCIA
jgi:hypothetical protein